MKKQEDKKFGVQDVKDTFNSDKFKKMVNTFGNILVLSAPVIWAHRKEILSFLKTMAEKVKDTSSDVYDHVNDNVVTPVVDNVVTPVTDKVTEVVHDVKDVVVDNVVTPVVDTVVDVKDKIVDVVSPSVTDKVEDKVEDVVEPFVNPEPAPVSPSFIETIDPVPTDDVVNPEPAPSDDESVPGTRKYIF